MIDREREREKERKTDKERESKKESVIKYLILISSVRYITSIVNFHVLKYF
jgi:hypothetical protein